MSQKSQKLFHKRKHRNRFTLKSKSTLGHRLSVYRSNANIYVQLIDDKKGSTILACSSLDKNIKKITKNNGGNIKAAELVGLNIAKTKVLSGPRPDLRITLVCVVGHRVMVVWLGCRWPERPRTEIASAI